MQLVAVYGSLLRDLGNHPLLGDSELVSHEEVVEIPFKMIDLGWFPGLLKDEELHKITIEVYKVDDDTFKSLDGLEGYPNFYNRKLIETVKGNTWIYYLNDPMHYTEDRIVKSGNWRECYAKKEVLS